MALADSFKAEKILKLPWWQKATIVGAVSALLLLTYFFTLDRTYTAQISKLNTDIDELVKKITDLETIETDLSKFERQNARLRKELDKAMTKLPSTAQIDELLKDVTWKAKNNGIEVGTFERATDVAKALYVEVPVKMKLRANFFPLMIFWNELARMERIVNVSDISIKASKASGLEINCVLTAYRFSEQAPAAPAPKASGAAAGKSKVKRGGDEE